jgi:hypothetical protein
MRFLALSMELIACAALAFACWPAAAQQPPPPAAYLATQPSAAASWPHTLTRDGATATIYQPQAVSWPDRQRLTARAAVAIQPAGAAHPFLGSIELSLATSTDMAAGIVHLSDPTLLATHFPELDTTQAAAIETKIRAYLPEMATREVPLTSVLLSLKQSPVAPVAVNNDPPAIFHAERPASLVVFDGEPVLVPAGKSGLSFAANTNWDVFIDQGTWYLLNNGQWLSAPAVSGPYIAVKHLPPAFSALPNEPNFADARKHIPAVAATQSAAAPEIFVSTKPAEIIVTQGTPRFVPVAGTGLQRVGNTSMRLYFHPGQGQFYVLLSGRWFSAAGLDGPWQFATDRLPGDFALISPSGPDEAVLVSVPGTVAAQEALLKAQIPTTATLTRSAAKFTVVYSGTPRFEPIPGTSILYAANTNAQVLRIGNRYYACESGAWFAAETPMGPWALADSLPPEIHAIPPSSPFYNVTYVQIYAATPVTVTYGYTAGYTLGYVSAGTLVYGTGYYYPPVIVPGPVPIYYPYPYTYAGSVWYSSTTGAWARGGTVYGSYGGAVSGGSYYNPSNGAWAHGAAVYGPNGGAGAWSAYNPSTGGYAHGSASWGGGSGTANAGYYNPRTGVSGSTNQNVNPYGRWGSSTFSGPNQTVKTQSGSNAQGRAGGFSSTSGAEGAGYHNNATGVSGGVGKGANGDVYAGRDGNAYRHTDDGWSKWNNGSWSTVQPPKPDGARTTKPAASSPGAAQGGGQHGSFDRENYQQLEHDRLGRQGGGGYGGGFGGRGGGGGRGHR